ncbi:MAG: molybdate ABC transporter substrate-binding protein [Kofleriaceae bacterium]
MVYRLLTIALVISLALSACKKSAGSAGRFEVAAAADLALAFAELGKAYTAKHHATPVFSFGSTGLLAKQIGEGAPFALFAAANESFVEEVVGKGKCDRATVRRYARGRIVVWTPAGVKPPATLQELSDPRFKRIAIANPAHAPYGKAAEEALRSAGLWASIEPRLVLGENVRATLQFAQTGNVDASIVALSLSVVTDGGASLPIDPSLHKNIDQALVVCGGGEAAKRAQEFADYVGSKEGREIMERYGFSLPEPR